MQAPSSALTVCLTWLSLAASLNAQARALHTRDLTRLSQPQVAAQLAKSDVIFIPVGAVETNGIQPSSRDYTYAQAFAITMANQTGSLHMPGLMWSYPGTTIPAPSTIHMTIHSGTLYLKELAHSLLRQGFRRQVYLSYSHGPAPLTVGTLVREFFDETRVPILYINMDTYLPRLKLPVQDADKLLYGAHRITNRIEDLALESELKEPPMANVPTNSGLATLGKLGFSGSLTLGSWINDVMAHGTNQALPKTSEERMAWAIRGEAQIGNIVKQMSLPLALEALREHDRYTQEIIVPRLKANLP